MGLDRQLQKRILQTCSEEYPNWISHDKWRELEQDVDEHSLIANLTYLYQHGLMGKSVILGADGHASINLSGICCTEKGMDFLEDDGGLGAILGAVTIKFHEDTLRVLLERKVIESDAPPEEKSRLLKSLKGLSAEAIKHLTLKLLDEGLGQLPGAVALLGTYLQQAIQ